MIRLSLFGLALLLSTPVLAQQTGTTSTIIIQQPHDPPPPPPPRNCTSTSIVAGPLVQTWTTCN